MDPALREFDVKGLFWVERSVMPSLCGGPALGAIVGGLRGFSRRGRRSYRGDALALWEPRPRGDCGWFAGDFATGASLLQGGAHRLGLGV
jgi:hypothetical protein